MRPWPSDLGARALCRRVRRTRIRSEGLGFGPKDSDSVFRTRARTPRCVQAGCFPCAAAARLAPAGIISGWAGRRIFLGGVGRLMRSRHSLRLHRLSGSGGVRSPREDCSLVLLLLLHFQNQIIPCRCCCCIVQDQIIPCCWCCCNGPNQLTAH